MLTMLTILTEITGAVAGPNVLDLAKIRSDLPAPLVLQLEPTSISKRSASANSGFDSPEKLATRALPRERFSRVLGMFSSLEVKFLYPT